MDPLVSLTNIVSKALKVANLCPITSLDKGAHPINSASLKWGKEGEERMIKKNEMRRKNRRWVENKELKSFPVRILMFVSIV